MSLPAIIAAATLASAPVTVPPPAPAGQPLLRAWEGRYEVLAPRCGYRPESWASALDRALQRPVPDPALPPGTDVAAWQRGAVQAAKLAAQHLLDQFNSNACEVFVDGVSLSVADRIAATAPPPVAGPPAPDAAALSPDWLQTAWPDAIAALLERCGTRTGAWHANARAKLLAGSELSARAEGLPTTEEAQHARLDAATGVLDMLDAVGTFEFDPQSESVCATAAQSPAAAELDRLVATNPYAHRRFRNRR